MNTILHGTGKENEDTALFYKEWKKEKERLMYSAPFRTEKELFKISLANVFMTHGIMADSATALKPMIDSLFGARKIYPDVRAVLDEIHHRGIDTAIGSVTDNDSLMYILRQNDLSFEQIYTSEKLKAYKPCAEFFERMLAASGWNAQECMFVGDSLYHDLYGAKNSSMKAVLIDRKGTYRKTDIIPDAVISSFDELLDLI